MVGWPQPDEYDTRRTQPLLREDCAVGNCEYVLATRLGAGDDEPAPPDDWLHATV